MATFPSPCRLEQRLKIKLGEAKNIIPRNHGSVGQRDIYCAISLDKEEIFRSATIEKTLDPFFGEEFQFNIPREFQYLSFYLYDRDRPMKTDKIIGKVSVKKELLQNVFGKDHWYAITPVDADSEVQGKVQLEIALKSLQCSNDNYQRKMVVRVKECCDLSIINGSCDPYATVTVIYSNHKEETKRSKFKKKTTNPCFYEDFSFEIPVLNTIHDKENVYWVGNIVKFHELRIVLWHDSGGISGNVFLGEVKIDLSGYANDMEISSWYQLQPREKYATKSTKNDLGMLRINLHYTADTVLMTHCYDAFRNFILQSASQKYTNPIDVTSSVAWLIGEVIPSKLEVAQPLTRILLQHGLVVPFLTELARLEISKTSDTNTLFRGNTLVSKCMDELMKLAGHHYLKETLSPILENIFRDRKPCEIDSSRLSGTENRENNMNNFIEYIKQIIEAISRSALNCPPVMCQVFSEFRELANTYFPNKQEVRYSVISSFVFLRYFAPAILGPKLFDLTSVHIDTFTHRTLTLLSKAVQSIGNQVCFRNLQHSFKETHMQEVFDRCLSDRSCKLIEGVRTYLEIISQIPNGNQRAYGLPVTLKEGVMVKRAQERKKFGIKSFRTRYFKLTTREFTYYKKKGSQPLCSIPVDNILGVEKVEEASFKCKNMFQIIHSNRPIYIQAPNCVEEQEWMDLLNKVLQYNSHRLRQYHPGAFIDSHWLCCRASSENAPGCSAVSTYLDCDLKVQIDSDKEMERIYSLLRQNYWKLEKLLKACEKDEVSLNNADASTFEVEGIVITHSTAVHSTVKSIVSYMSELEKYHKSLENSISKSTHYGSKQSPIGCDNYLLFPPNNCTKNNSSKELEITSDRKKSSFLRSSLKRN